MKNKLIILIFLVLSAFSVFASVEYGPYLGVGESELFKYYPVNSSLISEIVISGNVYSLNRGVDYDYSYITCTEDEDLHFDVVEVNETTLTNTNYTDAVFESSVLMEQNKIYVFNKTETSLHNIYSTEAYYVCANLSKSSNINVDVVFYIGIDDGLNVQWDTSTALTVTSTTPIEYCSDVIMHTYYENLTNFSEYFGVSCPSCTPSKSVNLMVDLNTSKSSIIFNSSSVYYNYTYPYNFALRKTSFSKSLTLTDDGTFLCRTPFYYDVYLYKENESSSLDVLSKKSYCDEFSYISMTPYSDRIVKRTNDGLNTIFKFIPFYSSLPKLGNVAYDDVVFWNLYENCHSRIKLYETGNYSLYAIYSKIKPQFNEFIDVRGEYSTYTSDVTGLYPIQATNNSNRTIIIHASLWELSNERYLSRYLHIGFIIALIILIPVILIFGIKRLFR